jgi:ASC-1-like (ASCH) protein
MEMESEDKYSVGEYVHDDLTGNRVMILKIEDEILKTDTGVFFKESIKVDSEYLDGKRYVWEISKIKVEVKNKKSADLKDAVISEEPLEKTKKDLKETALALDKKLYPRKKNNKGKIFCPYCMDYRKVKLKNIEDDFDFKNEKIKTTTKLIECQKCGEVFPTKKYPDTALESLYKEYERRIKK